MENKVVWVGIVMALTLSSLLTTGVVSAGLSLLAFSLLFTLIARKAWGKNAQTETEQTSSSDQSHY
ncbi:hypothetical protein KDD30_19840 (plasmid) [Photobacterium sp. GJ3]|uniref:hypothetical protein n=1 Tax=Photobacterium sp. GJ3 TaxID=2829502 RepID=UPI001B8BB61D|nr:hypothetical protein [Photobacterium sp. GJ3]QUJ70366.1 hypothetical protein KDD30_19840 [Photobacterium sp. GJ3]